MSRCMSLVEIPLNHYRYRFRRLNYEEEFALEVRPGEDARKLVLAAAMVDVSGLPVDREQAKA